jgi:hypothetical protein
MIYWVPILIASSILTAYLSFKSHQSKDLIWSVLLGLLNIFPLWALIVRNSRTIVLDGLVYDITLTVVYTAAILYFTSGHLSMTMIQWISVGIIVCGLIVFKLGAA